ncbi:MAG: hypothetical protein COW65_13990 [Cytophagales bacterium CG18_big_fil_WC_8_21_14_2_50_42_9]|nr:MAG: hypothetical protein COW65_13990 [Cytophagales bacterium CG18_big_fil_WC_8_21_14_2_50_42_9]
MKKIILLLALSVLGTGAIAANSAVNFVQTGQGTPGTPEERAERQLQAMTKQLSLSTDQSAKLKPILLQRVTEQQALRGKMQGNDRQARMTEMKTMREKYDAQFKTILTPEQYTKYEAGQAQMQNGRGGQGKGQGGARGSGQSN